MLRSILGFGLLSLSLASMIGCGQTSLQATVDASESASVDGTQYLLTEEPEGAVGVLIAKEDAKDQDEIVLLGRIGGQAEPFIKDRSAFMVIDPTIGMMSEEAVDESGEICMDDCCASLRTACSTLVKVVDASGKPLEVDARKLLKVKENDLVVVKGKVQRNDEAGTFTIAANAVFVRQ
ncbi:Hypothetical protein PBC10988_10920 [Planctomycetales bacterium 10988]|nr:Hypothetical protein PBC10988_10920 [Planctomycetales bacterium 10988]